MNFQINVERTVDGKATKIEAMCQVPYWSSPVVAINFLNNRGRWSVGTSIALPADVVSAKMIHECQAEAFQTLEEIKAEG